MQITPMRIIDAADAVVDLSSCAIIPGAVAANIDSRQVLVIRHAEDGKETKELLWVPAGIRIVQRR
jgi:hypothetical protein